MKIFSKVIAILIAIGCFFILFFLTGCSPIEKGTVLDLLLPDVGVFITHVVATLFLILIIFYLVWKPTKSSLSKRKEYIQSKIDEANKAKSEALKNFQDSESLKIKAFSDANEIIDHAIKKAETDKEKILSEARKISNNMLNQASEEILKMRILNEKNIKKQVLNIAFEASKFFLKDKINREESDEYVDEFIKKLDSKKSSDKTMNTKAK